MEHTWPPKDSNDDTPINSSTANRPPPRFTFPDDQIKLQKSPHDHQPPIPAAAAVPVPIRHNAVPPPASIAHRGPPQQMMTSAGVPPTFLPPMGFQNINNFPPPENMPNSASLRPLMDFSAEMQRRNSGKTVFNMIDIFARVQRCMVHLYVQRYTIIILTMI